MKIAIFGGSFNPVHAEHVNLARAAVAELGVDKLIVMPTAITPNKGKNITADDDTRVAALKIAFKDFPEAEISGWEIEQGGVSYSYKTCEYLAEKYKGSELFLLVGADMLADFPCWKYPERILNLVTVAACARENKEGLLSAAENFEDNFGKKPRIINYTGAAVSSTRCRVKAALGESLSGDMCMEEAEFLRESKAYFRPELAEVKNFLTEKRWKHTLNVAFMAAENCHRVGWDELSAVTAAALHDGAKYLDLSSPYLKDFTPPCGVPQAVMHQFTGAYMAVNYFNVRDENIINAIKYHCSGRENMSGYEKLIYLCDMLEEDRNFPGVDELRAAFYRDIDECFYLALEHQTKYLQSTGMPVYELTERAFEYLKENK